MRLAFQHCVFINADGESFPGSLVYRAEQKEEGFLAFLRLIGTAYFSKYRSCFPFDSPRTFLNSLKSSDSKTQHRVWLESIRTTIYGSILSLRMNCHLLLKHSGGIGFIPAGFPIIGVRLHRITAMF